MNSIEKTTAARRRWRLLWVVLVVAIAWRPAIAQTPERPAKIPRTDVPGGRDWQVSHHDGCRYAIPASWRVEADGSVATAPDGSSVSIRMFHITNWADHKTRIKSAFGRVGTTHEDSDHRLWFEIGDKPRVQHYVDVVSGLNVCSVLIELRSAGDDVERTTKHIAESVGPALGTY